MAHTVSKWSLRVPDGADLPDMPAAFTNLATDLSDVSMDTQGSIASRPVSSLGTPGIVGRYFRSTDEIPLASGFAGKLYRDNGAGWDDLGPFPAKSRGKVNIATAQSNSTLSYLYLTTNDLITGLVVPTDALVNVLYRAWAWPTAVGTDGHAAVYCGANPVRMASTNGGPVVGVAAISGSTSSPGGRLYTTRSGMSFQPQGVPLTNSDVTTGQTLGGYTDVNSTPNDGHTLTFEVAPGTYDIGVKFAGANASNRKLWVWVEAF